MQKKSQGGLNAAVLVAVIAGLIILYIILLPTAEREKIILSGERAPNATSGNVLLKEFPGSLSTSKGLEEEKKIPNIFLVETTNAKELERINPFIVRSGWFDKRTKRVDFMIDDFDNIDNVLLSFTAKKRKGSLEIRLNNNVIFESELAGDVVEPVRLAKNLLQKTNSLEFSVSSVGFSFWTTNEYSIENARIIGDVTDTSRQQSANVFAVSESEYGNMERASIRFIPYCGSVKDLGLLDIFINNKRLFSAVPVCDNAYKQSVPKSALNSGENNVVFKTGGGSYSVEQIKVSLEYRGPQAKTYYFEIGKETFRKIVKGDVSVEARLKFIDDKKKKKLKLDVNGHFDAFETDKAAFTRVISNKVSEGNNFIRIEPLEDLEVVELSVELR